MHAHTLNFMAFITNYMFSSAVILLKEKTIKYLFGGAAMAMAPHSSALAWKIPWTEEPGGLQSMGSLRVGHD